MLTLCRVRRSDLYSSGSSRQSSVDPETIDSLRKRTKFESVGHASAIPNGEETVQPEEEDELEFRLFAPDTGKLTTQDARTQVIRIRSPTPEDTDPGFINPYRKQSFFFAGVPSAIQAEQYALAAVSGHDIVERSRSYWPGSRYEWKVTSWPLAGPKIKLQTKVSPQSTISDTTPAKRTRLGKKSRIRKRQALEVKRKKAESEMATKADKERAEREKRAKRNREKKLKKRARDKLKKVGGMDDGEANDNEDGASSASDQE